MCFSFLRPLNHALNGCLNPKGIQVLKEYDNKMIQNLFLSFFFFFYLIFEDVCVGNIEN